MNITLTLFIQMAAFVTLIYFVNKVLWGPMSAMLEDRQKRIADGLAAADKGKEAEVLAEKNALKKISEAKAQASEIVAQAQKRSNEIVDAAKNSARDEADRIMIAANAEIEQEVNRAKEKLRKDVSAIALAGASKILKKEVNAKTHNALLKDLAAQI